MDNVIFGKFVRESRKEKGLTQKQLADLLHVSDKTVSKWENGQTMPDILLLPQLAGKGCAGTGNADIAGAARAEPGWDIPHIRPLRHDP